MMSRRKPTRALIAQQYYERVGRLPDLDNPRGLSEKLNRLKLAEPTALQTICVDKLRVREYVREIVGDELLIPQILTTRKLADINPSAITAERFVMKATHDWGSAIICRDRSVFDWVAARRHMARHLAMNHWYAHREPVYKDIPPAVLVEQYLEDSHDGELHDYKFFVFHGRPRFVMVVTEKADIRRKSLYDLSWNRLPVRRLNAPAHEQNVPRPACLDRMIEVSSALAAPFDFCRVDLYAASGRIWFGELTFFPEGGLDVFEPPEWEHKFGDMLNMGASKGLTARPAIPDARAMPL
jgi:hypothetical protein